MEAPEIFDIIVSLNHLHKQVSILIDKVTLILNNPVLFPDKKYYDEKTVEVLFNLSYRSLYVLRRRNLIPFERIGRTILYRKEEIDKLLSKSKKPSVLSNH
jgi:hypothetical protein